MSNLSDLLPAGASAKQITATDSGSGISSKAPVVLNSDGTVSAITPTVFSVGAQSSATESVNLANQSRISYDESANRAVAAYATSGTNNFTLVAGEISGSTITWGTPLVVESSITGGNTFDVCFDASNNCMVYTFKKSSTSLVTGCATLSGSVITADTANEASVNYNMDRVYNVYDATNNKVLVFGKANGTNNGTMWSVSVSGTTPTYSSDIGLGGITVDECDAVHDPDQQRIVVCSGGSGSFAGAAMLVDCSGSNPSSTGPVNFQATNALQPQITYNTTDDKIVIGYYDNNNSSYISYIAGTVDAASNNITFGTKTTQSGTNVQYPSYGDMAYDPVGNQSLYVYYPSGGTYDTYMQTTTLSGTTVVIGSLNTIWDNPGSETYYYGSVVYDPDTSKLIFFYGPQASPSYPHGRVVTPPSTNLSAQAFVGVADSAISASAAGSIIVQGGTVAGITDPFGTVTATYGTPVSPTVFDSNNKCVAYDSSNNRIALFYTDGSASNVGKCVIGELSGTSITWGTPVTLGYPSHNAIAFDSNLNRIVVAYADGALSSYGYATVGQISGSGASSTVTFGTPTAFNSSNSTTRISICFDSSDNRMFIGYRDGNNSNYFTYVIGTVSVAPTDNAITFSTPALVNGSSIINDPPALVFDPSQNKTLIAYPNGSYTGTVLNLALSSGTPTFGTPTVFGAGLNYHNFAAVYDSGNTTCGISFRPYSGVYPLSFSVVTMSGASVTVNAKIEIAAESDNTKNVSLSYDANNAQIGIFYRYYNDGYGKANYGTISGTSSSWGTQSNFASENMQQKGLGSVYDTTAQKMAIVYSGASDSQSTVITLSGTLFTTGTKYYVTTSGGFSSSADTPSVNAGLAISTTSLLLNGDS